jgi:hypothetical protein
MAYLAEPDKFATRLSQFVARAVSSEG